MEIIDPIYNQIHITESVLLELINSKPVQRLKGVGQDAGAIVKLPWKECTRFEHSVGVMHLIKTLNGNLGEQIAGLLHDISHTALSHAADFVFDRREQGDYHEKYLKEIIFRSDIPDILQKYGYNPSSITIHKNFSILERDEPALCADRIDYSLRNFYSANIMPLNTIKEILKNIINDQNELVFSDQLTALKYAKAFLFADQNFWGGFALSNTCYHLFAEIAKDELTGGRISPDDFFLDDSALLGKFSKKARDKIHQLHEIKIKKVGPNDKYDYHLNAKIRYVDPLVKIAPNNAKKLSEINPEFNQVLKRFLAKRKQGNYVKILP